MLRSALLKVGKMAAIDGARSEAAGGMRVENMVDPVSEVDILCTAVRSLSALPGRDGHGVAPAEVAVMGDEGAAGVSDSPTGTM